MVKSVMEKAANGQSLNDIDKAILAAAISKGMFTNFSGTGKKSKDADDDDKKEKVAKAADCDYDAKDDDKKNPFAKSLEDAASDNIRRS